MFELAIKKVIDRYTNSCWYIKRYPIDKQKEEILAAVKEEIVSAYILLCNAIDHPEEYRELYSYLEDFPLLHKCIKFVKQEGITLDCFNAMITIENTEKLKQEAVRLLNTILAKETEPYFKKIFEDRPTRKERANDLFKKERQ